MRLVEEADGPAVLRDAGEVLASASATTTLEFTVPSKRDATVRIYDVSGRLVRDVFTGSLTAGVHRSTWDGRDGSGNPVTPGLYFVRAKMGDVEYRRTIVRVR